MKFSKVKGTRWFNSNARKEVFGIKVFHDGKWFDASEGDKPMFFDKESARNAYMSELKA